MAGWTAVSGRDCGQADGGTIAQRRDGFQAHVAGALHGPRLPHAFGTTLDTIPAGMPYLSADPALAANWQELRGDKQDGFEAANQVCRRGRNRVL